MTRRGIFWTILFIALIAALSSHTRRRTVITNRTYTVGTARIAPATMPVPADLTWCAEFNDVQLWVTPGRCKDGSMYPPILSDGKPIEVWLTACDESPEPFTFIVTKRTP